MALFNKIFNKKKINLIIENGKANLLSENYFTAIKDFTYALELDKKNEEALFNRGIVLYNAKHYNDSKNDFLTLEKINPDYNPLSNFYLAKIFLKTNDFKSASEYADKYYMSSPDETEIQYFNARMKYFCGDFEAALILADRMCERNSKNFNIRYLRSLIYFGVKKYNESLEDLDIAIELFPNKSYLFNFRGLINSELEDEKEALEDFEYAIRLEPENGRYYFNKAKIEFAIGEFYDSKTTLEKALELDPNNKGAILLKSELNIISKNYEGAAEDLDLYLTKDPNNVTALIKNAAIKNTIYNFEGAKNDLEKAISIAPDEATLYYQLGFVESKMNDFTNAIKNLTTATEKNPELSDAFLQKGIIEFINNNFEDSIKSIDKYLNLQPLNEKAITLKTRALLELGKLDDAKFELSKIKDTAQSEEFFLLNSKINLADNNIAEAQKQIKIAADSGKFDESIELINNALKIETGLIDEIKETKFENTYKQDSQILNTLVSFEKQHYNTVKYRLSSIKNLDSKKEEQLKPLSEFINKELG